MLATIFLAAAVLNPNPVLRAKRCGANSIFTTGTPLANGSAIMRIDRVKGTASGFYVGFIYVTVVGTKYYQVMLHVPEHIARLAFQRIYGHAYDGEYRTIAADGAFLEITSLPSGLKSILCVSVKP